MTFSIQRYRPPYQCAKVCRQSSSTGATSTTTTRGPSSSSGSSSLLSDEAIIATTQRWFETIVIGQKLCPFATPLLRDKQRSKLAIVASHATNAEQAVDDVSHQARRLIHSQPTTNDPSSNHDISSPETTLIVFANNDRPFLTKYTDLVRLSWTLQEKAIVDQGFEHDLQIVLFHPLARHQTYNDDDEVTAADYTIRSPYPTVHLLRQEDVMRAVQSGSPESVEEVPNRNKAKFWRQGVDVCQQRLAECFVTSVDKQK